MVIGVIVALLVGVVVFSRYLLRSAGENLAGGAGDVVRSFASEGKRLLQEAGEFLVPPVTKENVVPVFEATGAQRVKRSNLDGEDGQERTFVTTGKFRGGVQTGKSVTFSLKDEDLSKLNAAQRLLLRADRIIPGDALTRRVLGG